MVLGIFDFQIINGPEAAGSGWPQVEAEISKKRNALTHISLNIWVKYATTYIESLSEVIVTWVWPAVPFGQNDSNLIGFDWHYLAGY